MAFLPQNEALLQVKPVQEQRWDLPFSIGDLLQPANNERTPINPIDAANQQQALQSKNTLENAQAVGAAQEANQKQRGFQLSMLNGVFALPPEQQEAALKSVVPMMNRLGGTQHPEDMSLAQAKMLAMANLSLEQIPQFQLNSQALPLMQGFAQRAGVNLGQPNQQSNPQSPQLPTTGTPMPANGITPNQAGGAPIPQGGGTPIDPNMMTAMAFSPILDKPLHTLMDVQKLQYESPQGKADTELNVKNSDNLSDVQKTFNVTYSNLPLAIERFNKLREAAKNASYGLGVDEQGKGILPSLSQTDAGQFLEPETAKANQTLHQIASQGILSELGPSLQGMRPNKFLESIASSGNLINFRDPPNVKVQAVNNIENQYIQQLKSLAEQRRNYGDKTAPTAEQIDQQVAQLKGGGTSNRVQVITPDGKMGTIDQSHVNDLIAAGGKVIK